jgi:hypothetical protein
MPDGGQAAIVINRGDQPLTGIAVPLTALGLSAGVSARDIWANEDLGLMQTQVWNIDELAPHDSVFLRFKKKAWESVDLTRADAGGTASWPMKHDDDDDDVGNRRKKVTLWMADPITEAVPGGFTPAVTVDSMIASLNPHRDSFTGLAFQFFAVCGEGSNDPGGDGTPSAGAHCSAADATGVPHLVQGHPTGVAPDLGARLTAGLGVGVDGRQLELWPVISYAGGRCTKRPGCVGNVTVLNKLLNSPENTKAFIADAVSTAHKNKLTGYNWDLEVDFMSANLTRFMAAFVDAMHTASPRIGVSFAGGHVADGPLCPNTTASCRVSPTIPMDRWISMATYTNQMSRFLTVLSHGVNTSGSAYGVGLCPMCFAANASDVQERFDAISQYGGTVKELYLWASPYSPAAIGAAGMATGMCWPPTAPCARLQWEPYWPLLKDFLATR